MLRACDMAGAAVAMADDKAASDDTDPITDEDGGDVGDMDDFVRGQYRVVRVEIPLVALSISSR